MIHLDGKSTNNKCETYSSVSVFAQESHEESKTDVNHNMYVHVEGDLLGDCVNARSIVSAWSSTYSVVTRTILVVVHNESSLIDLPENGIEDSNNNLNEEESEEERVGKGNLP